ncbi:hypothetical protein [Mycoplasma nasistruthionis]|uniref:Uncharacterized protein n=1 Tax=Mycoplasma nasistruthionis TaxID=353852 RepID=A0A4Y6I5G1_9MOLU|nr:hypothetical protein [Mycoplasma nasistruthionis]QDF64855.1 hypothetical protein FIV53_00815 [Mycoplasma nasistruthionis]
MSNKFIVIRQKRKDHTYIFVAVSNGFAKGYSNQIGIGRLENLEKLNPDPISTIRNTIENISITENKQYVKELILKNLSANLLETKIVNYGVSVLENIINQLDLFGFTNKIQQKKLTTFVLNYFIQNNFIFNLNSSDVELKNLKLINLLTENKDTILSKINQNSNDSSINNIKSLNDIMILILRAIFEYIVLKVSLKYPEFKSYTPFECLKVFQNTLKVVESLNGEIVKEIFITNQQNKAYLEYFNLIKLTFLDNKKQTK